MPTLAALEKTFSACDGIDLINGSDEKHVPDRNNVQRNIQDNRPKQPCTMKTQTHTFNNGEDFDKEISPIKNVAGENSS